MLIRSFASTKTIPRPTAGAFVALGNAIRSGTVLPVLALAASLLVATASPDGHAESPALGLRAEPAPAAAEGASPGLRLNAAGLRDDDVERAIWLIEDLGHRFQAFAQGEVNKHAEADWTALHRAYIDAAGKLAALRNDGRIVIADLPPQTAAALRDGKIVLDPLLAGSWRSDLVARERQVGGDDWSHISLLSGVLLQRFGRLQPHADWPWFQTHLRRTAALPRARVESDPEAAAALVRFGHLKDKQLLLSLLSTSAATPELRNRWSARREALSREVNEFLARQASALGGGVASAMAREWSDYGESAERVSESRVQAARRFPVPLLQPGGRDPAASGVHVRVTPPPRATGGLADFIEDAPERVKSPAPAAAAARGDTAGREAPVVQDDATGRNASTEPTVSAPAVSEPAVSEPVLSGTGEDAQAAAWRNDLATRQYQSGGVTIRIDGGSEPVPAVPEEDFDKFARVGDMAFRLMAPAAGRSEDGPSAQGTEGASNLHRTAPGASGQAPDGIGGDEIGGQGEAAESTGSLISIWLTSAADQIGAVISLIAFLLLATLVLLIILWIWLSERRRALAEPPIILSVLADEEPVDLRPAAERGHTVDAADWIRVDTPAPHSEAERTGERTAGERTAGERTGARAAGRFAEASGPPSDDYLHGPAETDRSRADDLRAEDWGDIDRNDGDRRSHGLGGMGHDTATFEDDGDRLPARRSAPAEDLEDDSETTPQDLVSALRAGHKSQFEIGLQRMTGLSASDIKAVIKAVDGEALATLCRALEVDELLFASIFMTLRRQYHDEREVPPHRLSQAIAAFARTTPEEARRQVERWVMDAEFSVVDDHGDRNTAFG